MGLQPGGGENSDTESQFSSMRGPPSLGIDEAEMLGEALTEALATSPLGEQEGVTVSAADPQVKLAPEVETNPEIKGEY